MKQKKLVDSKLLKSIAAGVAAGLFAGWCQAQPAIIGAQGVKAIGGGPTELHTQDLNLPSGGQFYVLCDNGGAAPMGAFANGQSVQLANANGNVSAELAVATSSGNSYTTTAANNDMGGFGISGFNYAQGFYGVNPGPGPNLKASVTFSLSAPALVVVIGMGSSQATMTISGLDNPTIDVHDRTIDDVHEPVLAIEHENLGAGTYTVQIVTGDGTSFYQTPANEVDLVGVMVFSDRPNVATSSSPKIPLPAIGSQSSPVGSQSLPRSFQLPANVEWYDTGISLSAGEAITISANGSVYIGAESEPTLDNETPAGDPNLATSDLQFHLPFAAPGLVTWSLVGKIGNNGQPFEVGNKNTVTAQNAGELYLSVNDNQFGDNSGNWNVTVTGGAGSSQPAQNPIENALVVRNVSISVSSVKYVITLGEKPLYLTTQNLPNAPTDSTRTDIVPYIPTGLLYSYNAGNSQPFQGVPITMNITVENTSSASLPPPSLVIVNTAPSVDAQGNTPQPQSPIQPSVTNPIQPRQKKELHYQFTPTWKEFKPPTDVQTLLLGSQISGTGSTIADATKYVAQASKQTSTVADKLGSASSFLEIGDNALNVAASLTALGTKVAVKKVTYFLQLQGQDYSVGDGQTSSSSGNTFLYPLSVCWQPPKNDLLDAYVISAWYEPITGAVSTVAGLGAGALASPTGPGALVADAGTAFAVQKVAMKLEPAIAGARSGSSDVAQILTVHPDYDDSWFATALVSDLTYSGIGPLGYDVAKRANPCPPETSMVNNISPASTPSPFTSHTITPGGPTAPAPLTPPVGPKFP